MFRICTLPPLKLAGFTLKIDTLAKEDIPHLNALQPDGWLPIVPYFEFYFTSSFCNPVKCVINDRIAGIGSAIAHRCTGWLAHIIVDKDFRRQGIGMAITKTLMDFLETSRRVKTLNLVSTPMGEPLYHRLGFRRVSDYVFLRGGQTPSEKEAAIENFDRSFKHAGLEMDYYATSEDRRELLEPHWKNACFIRTGGQLTGFFMPTLGEGFVLASSHESGLALLRKKHCNGQLGVIPEGNQQAVRYMHDHGFSEYRRGIRMFFGQTLQWRPEMIYGRVGGNLG